MKILTIQTAGKSPDGFELYIPKPFSSMNVTIGGKEADVVLDAECKTILSISPNDEGVHAEVRSGSADVDDKPIKKSRYLKAGNILKLCDRSFVLSQNGGWAIREAGLGGVTEEAESLWGSGFEVFGLPFDMNIQSDPSGALTGLKEQLHLNGVSLYHIVPGKPKPLEYVAGTPYSGDKTAVFAIVRNGMLYLSSSPSVSVMAAGHQWADGSLSILFGWAERAVSVGYLANVYNRLPGILASLAVLQRSETLLNTFIEERFASMGMLSAGMSHILNNLFGAIYGYANLAKMKEEFVPKLIDTAVDSTKRVRNILEVLMNLSPKETKERYRVNVAKAINDVVTLVEAEAARRNVCIRLDIDSPGTAVYAEPINVYQTILALMLNGMENTPSGKTLRISTRIEDQFIAIVFTGAAAQTETSGDQSGVERPLTRAGESYNVLLARSLAGVLGGKIIANEITRASENKVLLPMVKDGPDVCAGPLEKQTKHDPILVIDDEPDYQKLVAYALKPHAVECAGNVEDAIRLLRSKRYRAVVLDLVLGPGSGGDDIYSFIVHNMPEVKIVVVTGVNLKDEDHKRFEKAAAVLLKPFDVIELRKALGL